MTGRRAVANEVHNDLRVHVISSSKHFISNRYEILRTFRNFSWIKDLLSQTATAIFQQ